MSFIHSCTRHGSNERNDRMSIQKRIYTKKDGKKSTWYYANVWNPKEQKSVYGKMRTKRKDAVQDEAQIIKDLAAGKRATRKKQDFGRIADLWLESARHHLRASTFTTYESYYNRYIKDTFQASQVDRISTIKIQGYINAMSEKYSPETVNKCINILSDIFRFSIDTLKLLAPGENPMTGIKRLKVPYKKKTTWTDEQVALFLNSSTIKGNHYYAMFCVSLLLGMRPGEVCGLAEDDFIEEQHIITLNRAMDKSGNITDTKTAGSVRALYLPETLYQIIKDTADNKKRLKAYHPDYQHDFLFTSVKGRPVNPNRYSAQFRKAVQAYNEQEPVKLPPIPLYNCRHTFATNNYERGESDKVLSDIMGNSPKTFLQSYAHIRRRQSVKAVADYEQKIFHDFYKKL